MVEALLEARADPTLRAGRNDAAVGFSPLELVDALLAEQAESGRGPTVEARLCAALLRRAEVRRGGCTASRRMRQRWLGTHCSAACCVMRG